MSKTCCGCVEISLDWWWTGKTHTEEKASKIIDIVHCALKMGVTGVCT